MMSGIFSLFIIIFVFSIVGRVISAITREARRNMQGPPNDNRFGPHRDYRQGPRNHGAYRPHPGQPQRPPQQSQQGYRDDIPLRKAEVIQDTPKTKEKHFDLNHVADPEVKKAVIKGNEKLKEIRKFKNKIENTTVKKKIEKIALAIEDILQDFIDDPRDVKLAKNFMNHYLDSTVAILKKYSELNKSGVMSDEARQLMAKAEQLMDTIEEGFRQQLMKLQENDVLDMQVEMETLQKTMKMDGF